MIEWAVDATGTWTNMQIELKTGANLNMVPLKGASFSPHAQRRPARSHRLDSDHHN